MRFGLAGMLIIPMCLYDDVAHPQKLARANMRKPVEIGQQKVAPKAED